MWKPKEFSYGVLLIGALGLLIVLYILFTDPAFAFADTIATQSLFNTDSNITPPGYGTFPNNYPRIVFTPSQTATTSYITVGVSTNACAPELGATGGALLSLATLYGAPDASSTEYSWNTPAKLNAGTQYTILFPCNDLNSGNMTGDTADVNSASSFNHGAADFTAGSVNTGMPDATFAVCTDASCSILWNNPAGLTIPYYISFTPAPNTTITGTTTASTTVVFYEPPGYHSATSTVEIDLYEGGGVTLTLAGVATGTIPASGINSFQASFSATTSTAYDPIVSVDGVIIYPPPTIDPTFFVGSNPLPGILSGGTISTTTTGTCSLGSVSDCYANLKAAVAKKPPFGYIFDTIDVLTGINASGTPAFTLATSSAIYSNIFTPLRADLSWLLYFCAGLWLLVHRIRHLNL